MSAHAPTNPTFASQLQLRAGVSPTSTARRLLMNLIRAMAPAPPRAIAS